MDADPPPAPRQAGSTGRVPSLRAHAHCHRDRGAPDEAENTQRIERRRAQRSCLAGACRLRTVAIWRQLSYNATHSHALSHRFTISYKLDRRSILEESPAKPCAGVGNDFAACAT